MLYLINLIISCFLVYFFDKTKNKYFIFLIFMFWVSIIGGQYGVGTDYFSYLEIFKNKEILYRYFIKKEYLFYYFVNFFDFIEEKQCIFFIIAFIENFLFFKLIFYLKKRQIINNLYIFIFVFLCYGTTFYNQMNGIRQYFNVYLLTFLIIFGYDKKFFKYLITIIVGINIHASFILFSPIIILNKLIKRIGKKTLIFFLCISFIIAFLPITDLLKKIVKFYPRYSHYVNNDYFNKISFQGMITKIIYLPFYIQSTFLIKKLINNKDKLFILKIGILAFAIKLFCLSSGALNRIGESFGIIILFPIYFLIEDYVENNKKVCLFILMSMIIILYFFKILIFPNGEYLYRSYFFI